jgi:ABC-type multidrug transport system fused ATPase/permease subunit
MASNLEASMVSVERVREYCRIEKEAARTTNGDDKLPPSWPSGGRISFQSTKLRYRSSLPLVLLGLDVKIPERRKAGVVGRTGE